MVKANIVNVFGLSFTLQRENGTGWGDEVALCGADTLSISSGSTEEKDVSDFCTIAGGSREKHYGAKAPDKLSINFIKFDPFQDGQKLFLDAPINTKFKATLTIANYNADNDMKMTFVIQKTINPNFEIKAGEIMSGSLDVDVIGEITHELVAH